MKQNNTSGRLIILHAGSLTNAFGEINKEFKRLHPDIEITDEHGGSASLVRDVIRGKECSVLASADYNLISQWMLPDFATWCVIFASNQMVLRYTDESKHSDRINGKNWFQIMQEDGVALWHHDADGDPGGYRALMVLQLAEKYYMIPGFYDKMMASHCKVLNRATSQESKSGYSFSYGIPSIQSGARYILLPDEINLAKAEYKDYYAEAVVKISGVREGEKIILHGEPILFGVTTPIIAPIRIAQLNGYRYCLVKKATPLLPGLVWFP